MFGQGNYAKVWEVKKAEQGNYYLAQLSTSRKTQDGYEKDWSDGRVRLVGEAAKKAATLAGNERIRIGSCGVTNTYDKEKKVMYTNYVVFDFDLADGQQTQTKAEPDNSFVKVPNGVDEELPFN